MLNTGIDSKLQQSNKKTNKNFHINIPESEKLSPTLVTLLWSLTPASFPPVVKNVKADKYSTNRVNIDHTLLLGYIYEVHRAWGAEKMSRLHVINLLNKTNKVSKHGTF